MTDVILDATLLRIERLTAAHVVLARDDIFAEALDELVDRSMCRRDLTEPLTRANRVEAACIVVSGLPGAGKSRMVDYGIAHHARFQQMLAQTFDLKKPGRVLHVETPESCSLKSLAKACLLACGVEAFDPRKNRIDLWNDAKLLMTKCNVRVIKLDEFQNILAPDKEAPTESLMKHVRSLLIHPDNPMAIIAIGQPITDEAFRHDGSICRRHFSVKLPRFLFSVDKEQVDSVVSTYASSAGLTISDVFRDWLCPRLIHASAGEFGILTDWLILACKRVLRAGGSELTAKDFEMAFD